MDASLLDGRDARDLPDLARRAASGDRDALADLFESLATPLYRFVRARAPDPADSEDLVHEIFLAVSRALPRYESRPGASFLAWVFQIARNDLRDAARKAARRPGRGPSDALAEIAATGPGPEATAVVGDERSRLWTEVAGLRPAHRDVLALRFGCELSVAETAQAMGRSEGSVKVLQHRALRALRRRMEGR